jgi:cytochrome c-type biogenesis protein CcmF
LWGRIKPRDGAGLLARTRLVPRAVVGMMVAHLGIAVFIVGVTMVKGFEVERDVRMAKGDTTTVAGHVFKLQGLREVDGPNYRAMQAWIEVTRDGKKVTDLLPEKRVYRVQSNPMTEAAINTGFTRDLYVSLGEQVDGGAWIVRVYYKPFVDWIWGGCLIMALGGLLAATDRRYRRGTVAAGAAISPASLPAAAPTAAPTTPKGRRAAAAR